MMFPDLTQVNVPFGLLDRETQEALKAHGGPYECFAVADGVGWKEGALWDNDMETFSALAWRVKPAPPKPREWWAVGKHLHETEADALAFRRACADLHGNHHLQTPIIRVREVLE